MDMDMDTDVDMDADMDVNMYMNMDKGMDLTPALEMNTKSMDMKTCIDINWAWI
jgi:hypothetical protein